MIYTIHMHDIIQPLTYYNRNKIMIKPCKEKKQNIAVYYLGGTRHQEIMQVVSQVQSTKVKCFELKQNLTIQPGSILFSNYKYRKNLYKLLEDNPNLYLMILAQLKPEYKQQWKQIQHLMVLSPNPQVIIKQISKYVIKQYDYIRIPTNKSVNYFLVYYNWIDDTILPQSVSKNFKMLKISSIDQLQNATMLQYDPVIIISDATYKEDLIQLLNKKNNPKLYLIFYAAQPKLFQKQFKLYLNILIITSNKFSIVNNLKKFINKKPEQFQIQLSIDPQKKLWLYWIGDQEVCDIPLQFIVHKVNTFDDIDNLQLPCILYYPQSQYKQMIKKAQQYYSNKKVIFMLYGAYPADRQIIMKKLNNVKAIFYQSYQILKVLPHFIEHSKAKQFQRFPIANAKIILYGLQEEQQKLIAKQYQAKYLIYKISKKQVFYKIYLNESVIITEEQGMNKLIPLINNKSARLMVLHHSPMQIQQQFLACKQFVFISDKIKSIISQIKNYLIQNEKKKRMFFQKEDRRKKISQSLSKIERSNIFRQEIKKHKSVKKIINKFSNKSNFSIKKYPLKKHFFPLYLSPYLEQLLKI